MRSQPLFSIDSRSLTLFRICICLWTFRDLYRRLPNLEAWHTDDGVLEPFMTPHKSTIHQILFYRGSCSIQLMLFAMHFITTCNLLIGYKTSISSILHFIFTISIQERMYYILDGGDRLFRHLCFWLIFLPSWHGNATSIDAIHIQSKRKKYLATFIYKHNKKSKASKHKEKHKRAPTAAPQSTSSSYCMIRSFATAAILIQSMIIYPFIILLRLNGSQQTWSWSKCSAVHNAMASYLMSKDVGLYLAGFSPLLTFILCRITIVFEVVFPILLLIMRWDMIKVFILFCLYGMQLGFNICIRVENFGYSVATSMILFIPSLVWDVLLCVIQRISILSAIKVKMASLMMRAARTFKLYERVANQNKEEQVMETEHLLLWDIVMISQDEKRDITMIGCSSDIGLLHPLPNKWNNCLSLFFFFYLFVNNLGDARLFGKPDGGNIGEILRLDQQWNMYGPDVMSHTMFDLLIAQIEINQGNEKIMKMIVVNDLLTSNWKKVTVFEGIEKYKRPFNPTYINADMRWERLFEKVSARGDMMNSVLSWFCKHIKGKELMLKYQNHLNKYDNGIPVKQELVEVNKMIRAGWCKFEGDIMDMWQHNTSVTLPQYLNETIQCYHQITCPSNL